MVLNCTVYHSVQIPNFLLNKHIRNKCTLKVAKWITNMVVLRFFGEFFVFKTRISTHLHALNHLNGSLIP